MEYIGSLKQDRRGEVQRDGEDDGDTPKAEQPRIPPSTIHDNYPDTTINPYELMGLTKSATDADIKRAYKKGALRCHPDKHPVEEKSKAQKAFQRLTTAYAVLSDPLRREHYDATGQIHDALHMNAEDPWRWQPFFQKCWNQMSHGDVEAFAKEYRFSEEERQDLLTQYKLRKGDMSEIYEHVTLSNPGDDDDRYRKWINEAIEAGEVEPYKAFVKETTKSIKRRKERAKKEAQEAEEMKKILGKKGAWFDPPSDEDHKDRLAVAIQEKNKSRSVALLDRLMEKYVKNPGKKGGKKSKTALPDEPSDEAFELNRRKGFEAALKRDKEQERKTAARSSRKRKVQEVEEEVDEDEHPVKRWNRDRKKVKQQMADDAAIRAVDPSDDEATRHRDEMDDAVWGEPAPAKNKRKAAEKVKKEKESVKAGSKAKVVAPTKGKKVKQKKTVIESDSEGEDNNDDAIELGSQDSDDNDDEE